MQSLSVQIREGRQPPERALIHWDNKLMDSLDRKLSEITSQRLFQGLVVLNCSKVRTI